MRSRIVHLPAGPCTPELLRAGAGDAGEPDLVLGFLPPDGHLAATLDTLAALWPGSLRFGCEASFQVAGAALTRCGSLQLLWFDDRGHGAALDVIEGSHEAPPPAERAAALARRLAAADGALLLMDGERFPAEAFLAELRRHLGAGPRIAGGIAGASMAPAAAGTRVFFRDQVLAAGCLALLFHGIEMRIEVVRGWVPASPVYTVDRAAGNVLWAVDGTAATNWYRRFFTADGALAPMPSSAHRFPLLVEGPKPERQGVYRAMRSFDEPSGSVTFWGSVETGDRVRLAMRDGGSLPAAAAALPPAAPTEAAILCGWDGNEVLPGDSAGGQLAAMHEALGRPPLAGLLTCAEIGPTPRGDLALCNQTTILALLSEKRS